MNEPLSYIKYCSGFISTSVRKYLLKVNNDDIIAIAMNEYEQDHSFLNPLKRTPTCVYQGVRNISFLESFVDVLNE